MLGEGERTFVTGVREFVGVEALYACEGTREILTLVVGRGITGIGAFV